LQKLRNPKDKSALTWGANQGSDISHQKMFLRGVEVGKWEEGGQEFRQTQ